MSDKILLSGAVESFGAVLHASRLRAEWTPGDFADQIYITLKSWEDRGQAPLENALYFQSKAGKLLCRVDLTLEAGRGRVKPEHAVCRLL
ncbi:MAG: hypothetical protein M3O22_04600 [Pseudomonadota bacterium]|nr:hypothetical protein [Pseudomonadota bacterium]